MMTNFVSSEECIQRIQQEKIDTWFDLGLYLDRLREDNRYPAFSFTGSQKELIKELSSTGVAFITFGFSVDGVTIEILKYIQSIEAILKHPDIHLIGGEFKSESYKVFDQKYKKFAIEEAKAFNEWPLYKTFFFTKLERGAEKYNGLIGRFWDETKTIAEKLATYIDEHNIGLLYLVNVASNPGNVSLTLAIVLVSEIMGIPVINNNHDFYWEGGSSPIDLKLNRKVSGTRDFFFTNAHLGEVFSIIEVLFPWESRSWITVNINRRQNEHVIRKNGHNPANVSEIGTAINVDRYSSISKREKLNTFYQFHQILSRYKDSLVAFSVRDVLRRNMVSKDNPRPILIGYGKTRPIKNFMAENVIFLQPTRIIARKRIETGFRLISQMFKNQNFTEKFKETGNLKITVIVTGPIASGQFLYFQKLIERFQLLLESLIPQVRDKVFLAFLFSELDKEKFKKKFQDPVGIPELYNVASLVLLPSEMEGRGLPIIEAAAAGKPIFCRRYYPKSVYSEVIGEHLPEENRLKVIEYNGKKISKKQTRKIIQRVFFPHLYIDEIIHNLTVVKARFSAESLEENMRKILTMVYYQCRENKVSMDYVKTTIDHYRESINYNGEEIRKLVKCDNRAYLPGYHRLGFMIYLKSLIDPSAFRKEEQEIKGMVYQFAQEMLETNMEKEQVPSLQKSKYFNAIDNLFRLKYGELEIRHDHSLAYRHRNRNFYPYREFTFQELTGLINRIYRDVIRPRFNDEIAINAHFFTDWNLSLAQLTCSDYLAIDNRNILIAKMKENIPLILFPGPHVLNSLEFFALQAIRARLGLPLEEEMKEVHLENHGKELAPVYIFLQKFPVYKWTTRTTLEKYIKGGHDKELKLLYSHKLLKIIETEQWTVGIHVAQMGNKAIRVMNKVKEQHGLLITDRLHAAVMTDIMDIDRIHIAKAENPVIANILGIPEGSGFIQFVPAGIRTTIAYPTPIQTAKDFNVLLNGKKYKQLTEKYGEEEIIRRIKNDAETNGSPLSHVLKEIDIKEKKTSASSGVTYTYLSGRYKDGNPWNGILARTILPEGNNQWVYKTLYSRERTMKVTEFISTYEASHKEKVAIAWNGGYILNPELVGKLGLPEAYIGSPLGLLIKQHKIISPPLFNKPAFMVWENGHVGIERVNVCNGLVVTIKNHRIVFPKENYNKIKIREQPAYYDLMKNDTSIHTRNRVIVRLAGNSIMETLHNKEQVYIIPVGLTLSFPRASFPDDISDVTSVEIDIPGLSQVVHAVEAGPMLIRDGRISIEMEKEGWNRLHSIHTQAARLDYTDMRGPKIATGIDENGNVLVLAINGRIRESVGATHYDMAEILIQNGAVQAMGFDPGGSSTLVVGKQVLNISPYNHLYEENIYSLPPEPRAVANAVIGYIS